MVGVGGVKRGANARGVCEGAKGRLHLEKGTAWRGGGGATPPSLCTAGWMRGACRVFVGDA